MLVYELLKMIGLFMNGSLKHICQSDVIVWYFHGGAECMRLRCKRVGVVMSRSLKVHGIQMSLWGVH
jgi:hypothetical protein